MYIYVQKKKFFLSGNHHIERLGLEEYFFSSSSTKAKHLAENVFLVKGGKINFQGN